MSVDPAPPDSAPLSTLLIGTWELLSREDTTPEGELVIEPTLGSDPIAILFYDRHGHFAAQFMKRDRDTIPGDLPSGARSNNSRAQGGYDAYFGLYSVDDAQGAVTQRLVGALSRENVGQVLTRAMRVSGGELTIRLETTGLAGQPVTRTLRWRRVA